MTTSPLPFLPDPSWSNDRPLFFLPGGERISYGETAALATQFAALLRNLAAHPGDRVAVCVEKSWQAIALYLGCLKAGLVFLPCNPAATEAELAHVFGDAEPTVVIGVPDRLALLERAAAHAGGARILTLGSDGRSGTLLEGARAIVPTGEFPAISPAIPDEAVAAILYTSGTTGRPKGAMISHRALAFGARTLASLWRFGPDDVLLHALPVFHVHGLFIAINTVLTARASMRFLPRFEPAAVLGELPQSTVLMGVPTYYVRLLKEPRLDAALARHMRLFVSGSAPLSTETFHAFRERTGHTLLERYGMTETSIIASNPYDGERREGAVGLPLPGTELRIADPESGQPLPAGEIGSIEVRGPHLFEGYWRRPESRSRDFRDGYFVTGDLGRVDRDGYVHISGRSKDLIISGGFNVYPKEVEEVLEAVPGIAECAIIGLPHPDLGEAVTAVVVLRALSSPPDETVLLAAVERALARYKVPRRVLFVEQLPRNTLGKVLKSALRETHRALYQPLA